MSQTPPSTGPARILVEIDDLSLARWVPRLVESLRRLPGVEVFVKVVERRAAEKSSALSTFLSLEKMLVRGYRPCGSDRIGRADLEGMLPGIADFSPQVVIDLTNDGMGMSDGMRLRPLYDGQPGETALASALFFRGTPQIAIERVAPGEDTGHVVATGSASLEAARGMGGCIEAVVSRVSILLVKVLSTPLAEHHSVPVVPVRPIARGAMFARIATGVADAAIRAIYRLCFYRSHWRVGWRFVEPGQDVWTRRNLSGVRWNVLPDPVDHFYADPFALTWRGKDHVFIEDLDHKTGKGVISTIVFDEAGRPGPVVPVLEEPWHLSYPFLIERNGEVFMIPESSSNREVVVYRAVDFPFRWERHAVLLEGVEASDATIVEQDGLLFMFLVVRDGVGGYSDTLAIWWAEDLFGPWRPHPHNPVLVDDRTARPAGNFVRQGGVLYRPAQDCRRVYGAGLSFMRVTRLDREGFVQTHEGTVTGGGPWPGSRMHMLNYNGRLETIDGYTLRPKLKPAADIVDWWYRP